MCNIAIRHKILLLFIVSLFTSTLSAQVSTAKPWTYWWWMGGAVDQKDISYSLLQFKQAGIGGVHIIPIYGVKGYEKDLKPFLGSSWVAMLDYTVTEATKLGLGVDLSTGSGWPFGGPNVSRQQSAQKFILSNGAFTSATTGQQVKRAGPGGQGYVLDPFDKTLMRSYLARFDSVFFRGQPGLRSMYQDSYEVYGANWTHEFVEEFKKRRGYDLAAVPSLLIDSTDDLQSQLVKIDYQQTLSELLYESQQTWTQWSTQHHLATRYQAHGSPGNILDLYNLADIPETEAFGSSNFNIPLLRVDPDYPVHNFGRPNPLMMKFASSEAGVGGKQLISSETGTWLANHFKVSLSQVKPQVDELFTAGINHIFFHGTTYSPQAEQYPGWLFYASTNFGPSSHFYNELPLLNRYIYNCQTRLQQSQPDNDVLVYFPIQDVWADGKSSANGIHQLDVHHSDNWFMAHPFGKICRQLEDDGYTFDYISDKQLNELNVAHHRLTIARSSYKVLIIPTCTFMPYTTLQRLAALGRQGAIILFENNLPQYPTGYANPAQDSTTFEELKLQILSDSTFAITSDIASELSNHQVSAEMMATQKLSFIRKRSQGRALYFIANLNNQFTAGWLSLNKGDADRMKGYDPMNNTSFDLPKRIEHGKTQLWLSLSPGRSCFVIEGTASTDHPAVPGNYSVLPINTSWQLQFLHGRPDYHQTFRLDTAQTWTGLSDTAAFFTGTAKYTAYINISAEIASKKDCQIDLGTVNESASVTINGQSIGTAWSIPFRLKIPPHVLVKGRNKLEITVTNLSANFMRVYDQQHPEWKKFYDANIVDITYTPFDPSKWPVMPSGLTTNNLRLLYR